MYKLLLPAIVVRFGVLTFRTYWEVKVKHNSFECHCKKLEVHKRLYQSKAEHTPPPSTIGKARSPAFVR